MAWFTGLGASGEAWAQSAGAWPVTDALIDPTRGSGFYFSFVKLGLSWLVFLAWVYFADWVNQDSQRLKLKPETWNSIVVGVFIGAFLLHWILGFWLGFPLILLALGVPVGLYVKQRNAAVTGEDRVLTKQHLLQWSAGQLRRFGVKVKVPEEKVELPIEIHAQGGANPGEDKANSIRLQAIKGYNPLRRMLLDLIERRGGGLLLDRTATGLAVRFQIDGVFHDQPAPAGSDGASIFEVLKGAATLKPNEPARQQGTFELRHLKARYTVRLTMQGTQSGERGLLLIDDGAPYRFKLDDLGMRPKMVEELKSLLKREKAFVILSTLPGRGFSSLINAALLGVDRLMRNCVGIESAQKPEIKVENVPINTYDSTQNETAMTILPSIVRSYPDVYVMPELNEAAAINLLAQEVIDEPRLVVGGILGRDAIDSLVRVLQLKVPLKNLVPVLTAVVHGRLIRKLCDQCKEAYTPPPQLLQQLRLPADKVTTLYRVPSPPEVPPGKKPPPPCANCGGIGYHGRTGIYELLIVNDDFRVVLTKQPTLDALKQAAQKAGMHSAQEEALALVLRGVTSLEEAQRALKDKE